MRTKDFFNFLLEDIADAWRVIEVETNIQTKEIDIYLEYTQQKGESPDTGEECPIYDHPEMRRWRHLDTIKYKTFLNARIPRIKDKDGKVKTIQIPWASSREHFTYEFEKAVIDVFSKLLKTKPRQHLF